MFACHVVGEGMNVQKFDGVGKRTAGEQRIVIFLQIHDHAGEKIYMGRIG